MLATYQVQITCTLLALLSAFARALTQPQFQADSPTIFNYTTANPEEQTACVTPSMFFPEWEGSRLRHNDCLAAWQELYTLITPQVGAERRWTYWYEEPAPKPKNRLTHQVPLGVVKGSCHVAIVMLLQFPHKSGAVRLLPEKIIPDYNALRKTDEATPGDIDDAVNRNAWCLRNEGKPSVWVKGDTNSIGVFFWSSDSSLSLTYGCMGRFGGHSQSECRRWVDGGSVEVGGWGKEGERVSVD